MEFSQCCHAVLKKISCTWIYCSVNVQRTIQLFPTPRVCTNGHRDSLCLRILCRKLHVGDHACQPFKYLLATIIIPTSRREKESVVVIRCENKPRRTSQRQILRVSYLAVLVVVRRVGGSIGCLIVVKLYSRRYCRVGVRNARVGGGIAFGKVWWQALISFATIRVIWRLKLYF